MKHDDDILWRRFSAIQQEPISLHRRIEAVDTNLGILITAAVAFGLYGMGQHANWKSWDHVPFQLVGMVLTSIGALLCLVALVRFGDENKDWLNFHAFDEAMKADPAEAIQRALEGSHTAYEASRVSERGKTGYQKAAVISLVIGAVLYVSTGYQVFGQTVATIVILLTGAAVIRLTGFIFSVVRDNIGPK